MGGGGGGEAQGHGRDKGESKTKTTRLLTVILSYGGDSYSKSHPYVKHCSFQ